MDNKSQSGCNLFDFSGLVLFGGNDPISGHGADFPMNCIGARPPKATCDSNFLWELGVLTPTWWFKVPFLGWLSDPFKGSSDLQLGDQKATLNHLEEFKTKNCWSPRSYTSVFLWNRVSFVPWVCWCSSQSGTRMAFLLWPGWKDLQNLPLEAVSYHYGLVATQIFFIFIPDPWGNDPIWLPHIYQGVGSTTN